MSLGEESKSDSKLGTCCLEVTCASRARQIRVKCIRNINKQRIIQGTCAATKLLPLIFGTIAEGIFTKIFFCSVMILIFD